MKKSPKRFYSYVLSKQRNLVTVTRVHDVNRSLSSDDKDTARILCDQFQRVFVNDGEHDLLRIVSECTATTSQLAISVRSVHRGSRTKAAKQAYNCLLYTSDAADE